MTKTSKKLLVSLAALGAATTAAAAVAAVAASSYAVGDAPHGAALLQTHCGSCHGVDGRGKGPLAQSLPVQPPDLRDANFLIKYDDATLTKAIREGGKSVKKSYAMPSFEASLSPLDLWDIIAFVRQGQFSLTDFFADTSLFTSKTYTLDKDRLKRIEPAVGTLSPAELEVTLVGAFKGPKSAQGPVYVAQDPRSLDSLRPENKLGYLSCLEITVSGISAPVPACLALDARGVLVSAKVAPFALNETERAKINTALAGFNGQGGKSGKNGLYVQLVGRGTGASLSKTVTRAYYRTLAAAAMFDKEELERNPFD